MPLDNWGLYSASSYDIERLDTSFDTFDSFLTNQISYTICISVTIVNIYDVSLEQSLRLGDSQLNLVPVFPIGRTGKDAEGSEPILR